MNNIGWQIIDLQNHNFGADGGLTIPGVYDRMKHCANKVIVLINGKLSASQYVSAVPVVAEYNPADQEDIKALSAANEQGIVVMNVTAQDLVTFAVTPWAPGA